MSDASEDTNVETYEYSLTTPIEPVCDYRDCPNTPHALYFGKTIERDEGLVWTYPAVYCTEHFEEMGTEDENKAWIGMLDELA